MRTVSKMIQENIYKDVQNTRMFLVQMDSTQDISAHDQCTIVLRYYVFGRSVKECLIQLVRVNGSSVKDLVVVLY